MFAGQILHDKPSTLTGDGNIVRGISIDAARPGFDDSEWEKIGLPHSFSTPYFMSKDFYVGYGWYRKAFPVKKEILGKKSFLEFDGVFQEAEIFVNGHLAGTHKGGYTGFSIDISAYLKEGKNLVAVRVNNCWRPDLAPRAGEHVFSGGIYRNVRLVIKSPTYIDWYGTWVTTPDLAENKGKSEASTYGQTYVMLQENRHLPTPDHRRRCTRQRSVFGFHIPSIAGQCNLHI